MVADGCPRGITSSTRSWETQDRWWRNQGRPGFPKVADHPDRSKHVWRPKDARDRGARALDLPEPARAWVRKNGHRYGWMKDRVAGEPWHVEFEHHRDTMEDDMPTAREIVDELLSRRIEHTPGQTAASNRESATIERILGDMSAGGFRAWKDLPLLRAELAATRAALVALAKTTAVDPRAVERILTDAVNRALSDISITLTSGD